jgi:hypothetical protein
MSDETRPDPAAAPAPETKAPPRAGSRQAARAPAEVTVMGVPSTEPGADPKAQQQKVRFDSANIKSTYCNVCNATSTREEVVVNFGVNKTWDQGGQELEVQLEHRVILSPFAAKRLSDLLVRLIADHEQRYGKLS